MTDTERDVLEREEVEFTGQTVQLDREEWREFLRERARLRAERDHYREALVEIVEATMVDGNTEEATRAHLRAQAVLATALTRLDREDGDGNEV